MDATESSPTRSPSSRVKNITGNWGTSQGNKYMSNVILINYPEFTILR